MKMTALISAAVGLGLCGSLAAIAPADATSASATWNLHNGLRFQVNAWHCALYLKTCSWATSTKLLSAHGARARWIENKATVQAHGFDASITIGKDNAGVTLHQTSKSSGTVSWINFGAAISDNSGSVSPSWTTSFISTQSCGSAQITRSLSITDKCVYAGAV